MNTTITYSNENIEFFHSLDSVPNPDKFVMHMHERCEVYFFIKGKCNYNVEGSSYPLKSGDILIMRNAESHYPQIDSNYPYERMSLLFSKDLFSQFDPDNTLSSPFFQRLAGSNNIYHSQDFISNHHIQIVQNLISIKEPTYLQLSSLLFSLLYEISTSFQTRTEYEAIDSLPNQIVNYINGHLSETLSLDSICQYFFISKPHLCRIFKEATGTSIGQYINAKRILYAKELIQLGESPTTASTLCGFHDYSVFYRNYKKRYGYSPSETIYR
ncbi:MAG: AraC family transcriptional regulator [Eubacteriales bacterium]